MLGSVTEKVLRGAHCPVLAIRTAEPIRRILVTLDGSDLSEQALKPALTLAECLGAEVGLLRVVRVITEYTLRDLENREHGLGLRVQEEIIDEAHDYLRSLIAAHGRPGVKIHTAVRAGSAAQEILDFAQAYAADIIAMSTHGQTGLRRWVYGSITEKVLRGSHRSMLVIRPVNDQLK
jgi:nucleotide-binding universal stress UspA family protein